MILVLQRLHSARTDTIGILYIQGEGFECCTLEDEWRKEKVMHETRIPAGDYTLKLRDSRSRMHNEYKDKYDFHIGMLQLLHVPGFTDIYIHTGNNETHTSGCILVGDTLDSNLDGYGGVGQSVKAYKRLYPRVAAALDMGDGARMVVRDEISLEEALWIGN